MVKSELCTLLGRDYTEDEFQDLCFAFGIELDDVLQEEVEDPGWDASGGDHDATGSALPVSSVEGGAGATSKAAGVPTQEVWKIEVAANRYDLLCVEGIARALRTFLGLEATPVRYCRQSGRGRNTTECASG